MAGGEQRSGCECAVSGDEDRLVAVESVQDRRDAVRPLLQGGQRALPNGIGGSGAGLVEEDEPTE
jgi:hypothetical protein